MRRWELRYYVELAAKHNYCVVTVLPKTSWRWIPDQLATRNKHGLDVEYLTAKVKLFERGLPMYYGWFVNEKDSKRILELGKKCFSKCIDNIPEFAEQMRKALQLEGLFSLSIVLPHCISNDSEFDLKWYFQSKLKINMIHYQMSILY